MFLCPPSLIYLLFSLIQVIFDLYDGFYNTAFIKLLITGIITILLNVLCQQGLAIVAWIIVFLPFLFMGIIVSILLYIFGLDIAKGSVKVETGTGTGTVPKPPSTNSVPHGESAYA